jgi:hypothetical protein
MSLEHSPARQGEPQASIDPPAYTIDEFCKAHRISRSMYYNMQRNGTGPRTKDVGTRKIVPGEAAAEWRRS